MRRSLARLLDSPRVVPAASAASLALGVFFTFVWAPHPWSWRGIDQYHDLAKALARGETFGTTDVPWGYAYFVAAFYAVVGERAWVPVLAQVAINAAVPALLYALVRPLASPRTAALSALIAGVFSFNTIYASTQASDAVCTVLFLLALLGFSRGVRTGQTAAFLASGLVSGLVPQFRPNLILLPFGAILAYASVPPRARVKAAHLAVFAASASLALLPWIVHNYRLTGLFLPTSTHGGVQLWYGSLQVGPYLESRADNPRSIFESPAFDYTSLADLPIVVTADRHPCVEGGTSVDLVYWTDRAAAPRRVTGAPADAGTLRFEMPGQPLDTAVYYYFAAGADTWPPGGASSPLVYFVSDDHLGDADRRGDVLDAFDVFRLARHLAWGDPLPWAEHLDLDGDAAIGRGDLASAVGLLAAGSGAAPATPALDALDVTPEAAVLRLTDGSTVALPRAPLARLTDADVRGDLAGRLVTRRLAFSAIAARRTAARAACRLVDDVRPNDVFFRREPHLMRRYMALAFDNIRRNPAAFALASAYRAGRLFVIRGTDSSAVVYRYAWSRLAYGAGMALSALYLAVFLAGAVVAWRQRSALVWLLGPVVYVPLTICPVLTNMRYTVTVQPLMFAFVAMAVAWALGLEEEAGRRRT